MTPSRAESSRINGAKSHGPKTEDGRRAVSLNALKHGLTAETVVLPCESEEDYAAELRDYLHHFAPANKPEADLVRQLASAHWRLVRYTRIEASLLDIEMERQRERVDREWNKVDASGKLALAFEALAGPHSPLALLNRYEARLHREYQQVLKSLVRIQADRRASEAQLQNEPNQAACQATNAQLQNEPKAAQPIDAEPETTQPEVQNSCVIPMTAQLNDAPAPMPPPEWVAPPEERSRAASS